MIFRTRGLRVFVVGDRASIGETQWGFDGWMGHTQNGRNTLGPFPTERGAARAVAAAYTRERRRRAMAADRDRQWQAIDRSRAFAIIRKEARRITRRNKTDLAHLRGGGDLTLDLSFRRASTHPSGAAWARRVQMSFAPWTPWCEIVWVLTHELAHCVPGTAPRGSGKRRIVHGPLWQSAFCRIAERAHKVNCWGEWSDKVVWANDRGVDKALADALRERHGGVTLFDVTHPDGVPDATG